MGKELDEFERLFKGHLKSGVKPKMVWATVKEVDWNTKTMTVVSLVDDLEYYDVLLGIGSVYKKPTPGTKCLLGVIGNKDVATFLIEAEAVEEMAYKSDQSEFIIKEDGFVVKKGTETLIEVLNDFIDEVNKIVVIQGNTINKAAVTTIKQRLNTILKP